MFGFLKKDKEQKRPMTLMGALGICYYSKTYPRLPMFVCADDFQLSIQYDLSARRDRDTLELGHLSSYEPILEKYAEENENYDTVFSYVPISLVRHLVEDMHGGVIGWLNQTQVESYNKLLNKCVPNRNDILSMKISK